MSSDNANTEHAKQSVKRFMDSMNELRPYIRLTNPTTETQQTTSTDQTCKHEEIESPVQYEDERIWHVTDTYLESDVYWTATDAAFAKTKTRVIEYKCLGCGEEKTITTGEALEYVWKENMRKEAIAHMRDIATTGSWYNGKLWWEDNIWDGNAKHVATRHDWMNHLGYTGWKHGGYEPLNDE